MLFNFLAAPFWSGQALKTPRPLIRKWPVLTVKQPMKSHFPRTEPETPNVTVMSGQRQQPLQTCRSNQPFAATTDAANAAVRYAKAKAMRAPEP